MNPLALAFAIAYTAMLAVALDWPSGALMFASPAITAIIIAVFTVLSFSGGFAVSDWRSGREVQRLGSEKAVLRTANDKCAMNVKAVKAGVQEVTDALEAKKHAADAATKGAQYWASKTFNSCRRGK